MKSYFLIFIILLSMKTVAQETPISAFLEKWENSKNYLLEIVESMPEDKFDFKPTEREMSFEEQLVHIRSNILWVGHSYFSEEGYDKSKLTTNAITKSELKTTLEDAFKEIKVFVQNTPPNSLKDKVKFFAGPKTKLQMLNLLQDHLTHHRGQLIVYLNLNNIKPPAYSGW